MKKILCLLLAMCMLITLSGCSETFGGVLFLFLTAIDDDRADKDDIIDFVCENETALLEAIENDDYSGFENTGFIKDVSAKGFVVDFCCGGAGFGPETAYTGFYYSMHNSMIAVWCAPSHANSLVPYGDGYEWCEEDSDNRYYVEKICEYFYYYEASY